MSDVYIRPLALSDNGEKHEPIQPGRLLDPVLVAVSTDKGNLLSNAPDKGLSVTAADFVSGAGTNALDVAADDKLLLKTQKLLADDEKVLSVSDNVLRSNLSFTLSATTNVLELHGKDGALVAQVKLPVVPGLPTVVEMLEEFTPPPMEFGEQPKGTYLHLQFQMSDGTVKDMYLNMSKLVDRYEGGDGITVKDGKIAVLPEPYKGIAVSPKGVAVKPGELLHWDELVLGTADGQFKTTLSLSRDKNVLTLHGIGNSKIATVDLPVLPGVPVAEVLTDFTPPPEHGQETSDKQPGTYLHLHYELTDGKEADVYTDLSPLIDAYEGGDGIEVVDRKISVKTNQSSPIVVSSKDNTLAFIAGRSIHYDEMVLTAQENMLRTALKVAVDMEANEVRLLGVNDYVVSRAKLPASAGAPTVVEVVSDFTPPTPEGADKPLPKGTYLHMRFQLSDGSTKDIYVDLVDTLDVYKAGDGLALDGNKFRAVAEQYSGIVVSEKGIGTQPGSMVHWDEMVIVAQDNKLKTHLGLGYDKPTNDLKLLGYGNFKLSGVELPFGTAVPTVSEVLTEFTPPPEHGEEATRPKGTYLHLHYDLPGDIEQDIYIDLSDIGIQGDSLGDGLATDADGKLVLDPTGFISAQDKNALKLGLDKKLYVEDKETISQSAVSAPLAVVDGKLKLVLDPDSGLKVNDKGQLTIDMEKLASGVSRDEGNNLKNGSDGRPYYAADLGNI